MYNGNATLVKTGEVRLSYANLSEPRQEKPTDKAKYSVSLLIPKQDVNTLKDIRSSIEAAANAAQSKIWNGYRPPNIFGIVHDGDGTKDNGKPYGDECKGCWVLNASSIVKPHVVHISNIRIDLDATEIYSGMYGRVIINFYGYSSNGKLGVGAGLGHVMKTRDGEPLGGGISVEAAFAEEAAAYTPLDTPPDTYDDLPF